jgi:preprotein translocase subunit SecE
MAKIESDKSMGQAGKAPKSVNAQKPQAKRAGRLAGAISRTSSRSSTPRSTASAAPRGTVSTKPRGRVRTFLREVRIEMGKVTWPPRKEIIKSTGVVIVAVAIAGAFIGLFDFIWTTIVHAVGLG